MTRGFIDDDYPRKGRRGPVMEIAATMVRETPAAWLINDGDVEAWIPKSLATMDVGARHSIFTMPEWMAIEKGFA